MENPWFAQKNSSDAAIALVKNFIYQIKFQVSQATIEEDISRLKEFPFISFQNISAVLEKWGIKTIVYDWSTENLHQLPSPSILFIDEVNAGVEVGAFVMFTNAVNNNITYLHTRKGWVTELLTDFDLKWRKVALSILKIDTEGEPNFFEKETAYMERKKANPDLNHLRIKEDFLTDIECKHVIDLANTRFKRSLLGEDRVEGEGRTSYTAELHECNNDPVLSAIRKKVSNFLGLPESHFEHFQCVSYALNQEYQPHFDTFDTKTEKGKKIVEESGQRKFTVLVYLNDDFEGGSTHFPVMDVLVKPKKRKAVIFDNLNDKGDVMPCALHAGLPVTSGKKIAMNIWVRNKPMV